MDAGYGNSDRYQQKVAFWEMPFTLKVLYCGDQHPVMEIEESGGIPAPWVNLQVLHNLT